MTPSSPDTTPSNTAGCFSYLIFAAVAAWILAATVGVQFIAWLVDQSLLISGVEMPGYIWVPISWGHALLLALPVVPLAFLARAPRLRAAYRAWVVSIACIAWLALARAFPRTWDQAAAFTQVLLAASALLVLLWTLHARQTAPAGRPFGLVWALVLAPLITFPLLLWGALGSPLSTVLNLLAGLGLGLLAGVLLDALLFQPLAEATLARGQWRDLAFTALVSGLALVILGSGFGFGGTQLLLLIVLPPLGLAVAVLGLAARRGLAETPRPAWLAIGVLVGLVVAAILVFVDPDELLLLLAATSGEIVSWVLRAALLSSVLALAAGIILAVVLFGLRRAPAARASGPRRLGLAAVGVTWLVGLLLYVLAGQPGFHGDWLFVIMRDQADVSSARTITDRTARVRFVYETLVQHADTSQARLRTTLDRLHVTYHPYYLVNAIEVAGGPALRAYLAAQPEVDRVLDSPHLRPLPSPPATLTGHLAAPAGPQWNITSIGADRVWRDFGVTGQGIVVGQSDTGAQGDHPALRAGYRGLASESDNYNWLDPWYGTSHPTDAQGHGTHTLGSAVGRGGIGVAPGAQWFACVNLARDLANPPLYLTCMQFMLAPWSQGADALHAGDPARAADVINNSWGCPPLEGCDAAALAPAVSALRSAGIFVVASAGNDGPRCGSVSDPPAVYAGAFSVGAVDSSGALAVFSSRGPVTVDGSQRLKPDISAPGVEVLSSLPHNTYDVESGTSMAGPHVVGAVALMWSANPKLIGDIDRTEKILIDTARPYSGPGGCDNGSTVNNEIGHGLLDVYAAVAQAIREK